MCGIVGVVSKKQILSNVIDGLKKLEYRGYDSAGIAITTGAGIKNIRTIGKMNNLLKAVAKTSIDGSCAIGHTRWATHGKPCLANAHPHVSHENIAVVHNGIIENHLALKSFLLNSGYNYQSDTDTETIAHLIHSILLSEKDLLKACIKGMKMLHGSFAMAIICDDLPDKIILAKNACPLVIGIAANEKSVASDVSALPQSIEYVIYLEDGDVAEITANSYQIYDKYGQKVSREKFRPHPNSFSKGKEAYDHYMQKEIYEQPKVAQLAMSGRIKNNRVTDDFISHDLKVALKKTENIHIVACGTSYHAGLVARYWIEKFVKISCHVDIASEYRYRSPVVPKNSLFITISQSGETADSLAALKFAKQSGYIFTLSVCNVDNSAICRESDETLLTRAGIEIGVASTKSLTSQLIVLGLLTLKLAEIKNREQRMIKKMTKELSTISAVLSQALKQSEKVKVLAESIANKDHVLFLGRGQHYPIAMEAALKFKEISYIHAEAYAAGELKHGPLALVDNNMPVITVCPNDRLLDKLISNIEEVKARGGQMYVFADKTCNSKIKNNNHIDFENCGQFISPIVFNVPFQLLAYYVGVIRGNDVDQPRNLAKSVTVE